ncbi:unnamed protein product [Rotaria sp. Silwood2]|nr:unnamed protein product [Rotaria sp. Silwood2]
MAAQNEVKSEWYTTLCGECTYTLPKTGQYVAIKKLLRPFHTPTHAKRTYRELKLLICLNHRDADVIQLYDVFTPEENLKDFKTVYFVFNYVDSTLQKVIKRRTPIPEDLIKQIIYGLLRGLKFIHSAGIIHRDLKPANIGIDKELNIAILDFGLSRVASDSYQTGYVATRWWRAPEVIINWERYNEKIDIWSVGCIMAELILLKPIFPGKDHIDQLHRILDVTGTPDIQTLNEICTSEPRSYISRMTPKAKQDFNQLFGFQYDSTGETPISGVSPQGKFQIKEVRIKINFIPFCFLITGIDLLDKLLSFDHRDRPTTEKALTHEFLDQHHNPTEEPTMEPIVDEHENRQYTVEQWKSIVWQMVKDFVPPPWSNDVLDEDS